MKQYTREDVKFRHFIADASWPNRFAGMGIGYVQVDGHDRIPNSSENIWGITFATKRDGYSKKYARDEIVNRINGMGENFLYPMAGIVYTFPDHLYQFEDKKIADALSPILTRKHEYNLSMVLLSALKKVEVDIINRETPVYSSLKRDMIAAITLALVKTEFGL